jgi:heme O synthase-like polyprenyltransferase
MQDGGNLWVEEPTMKTIATPSAHFQSASPSSLVVRLPDVIALMKPRVIMRAVFTALVGLADAPLKLSPLCALLAVLAIAAGAGAAGILNMYDADIDAIMTRTAMRPIPRGKVSHVEALVLGLALATSSVCTNNIPALAFGVLIVLLVLAGSLVIMANLNENMMTHMQQSMLHLEFGDHAKLPAAGNADAANRTTERSWPEPLARRHHA